MQLRQLIGSFASQFANDDTVRLVEATVQKLRCCSTSLLSVGSNIATVVNPTCFLESSSNGPNKVTRNPKQVTEKRQASRYKRLSEDLSASYRFQPRVTIFQAVLIGHISGLPRLKR